MQKLGPMLGLWMGLLGCIAFLAQPSAVQAALQQQQEKQPTPHRTASFPGLPASVHDTAINVHWPPTNSHHAPELAIRPAEAALTTRTRQVAADWNPETLLEESNSSATHTSSSRQIKQQEPYLPPTATRATCITNTRRPAMRLFHPAAVQASSNQSSPRNLTFPVVIQLAAPADGELQQLINETVCGQNYSCLMTAAPPAAVVPGSVEIWGSDIAKVMVVLPASDQSAQKIVLTVQPDPCSYLSQPAELNVEVVTAVPQGHLKVLSLPALANSTFLVSATFTSPIASFDFSNALLSNAAIASISRSDNSSFIFAVKGVPDATAVVHLEPNSFISTAYLPGNGADEQLHVQVPGLLSVLPLYGAIAKHTLPAILAVHGLACLLAVHSAPATSLVGCVPSLWRSWSHLQLLAASSTLTSAGLGASYSSAAQQLSWSLLDWFPPQATSWAAKHTIPASSPLAGSERWQPAAANPGSKLDAWLADVQAVSALITVTNVSTASNVKQLQALPVPARAVQPQLPQFVALPPDLQGPAYQAWQGLLSSLEVAAVLLLAALAIHFIVWIFSSSSSSSSNSQPTSHRPALPTPAPVQFPLLVLLALLIVLPPVLFWSASMAGTRQVLWLVLAAMLGSGCCAAAVYAWLLHLVLSTAEDALLGLDDPESPTAEQQKMPGAAAQGGGMQLPGRSFAGAAARAQLDDGQQQIRRQVSLPVSQNRSAAAAQSSPGALRRGATVNFAAQSSPGTLRRGATTSFAEPSPPVALRRGATTNFDSSGRRSIRAGNPVAEATLMHDDSSLSETVGGSSSSAAGSDSDEYAGGVGNATVGAAGTAPAAATTATAGVVLQAVEATLRNYQQRLQQFRQVAYQLQPISLKSFASSEQQQQQHEQQEGLVTNKVAAGEHVPQHAASQPIGEAIELEQRYSSSQAAQQADGSNSVPNNAVAYVRSQSNEICGLPDVEELQRQEVLNEVREAKRRARLRRKLRKQRLQPDAVIAPRPLPLQPHALQASISGASNAAAGVSGRGLGLLQGASASGGTAGVYADWGLVGSSGVVGPQGVQVGSAGSAAVYHSAQGSLARWAVSVGLLQGVGIVKWNPLVVLRLEYMAKFGPVLWDIVGGVGMIDSQQESDLLQATKPSLLVANVIFAALVGVCCTLLGTIGPLGTFDAQVWTVAVLELAWLVYVVGKNPFVDASMTLTEALLAVGHVLLICCGVFGSLGQSAGQPNTQEKASMAAVCGLAGVVLFMAIVQGARCVVLVVSAGYAYMQGGRRRRRVVAVAH